MHLRPARENDQARIEELVRAAQLNPFGLDWDRFTIAETADGSAVGCAQLKPRRGRFVELASLVVDADWRGQGIAGFLIEHLLRQATEPVWLMCRSSLVPFYVRFGFQEVPADEDQPPYFARIRRLANVFHWLRGTGEYLAIMVRPDTL